MHKSDRVTIRRRSDLPRLERSDLPENGSVSISFAFQLEAEFEVRYVGRPRTPAEVTLAIAMESPAFLELSAQSLLVDDFLSGRCEHRMWDGLLESERQVYRDRALELMRADAAGGDHV